jgi:hypothetical protein
MALVQSGRAIIGRIGLVEQRCDRLDQVGRLPPRPGHVAEQPGDLSVRPGRQEEALAAIEEAATAYRQLARACP